MSTQFIQTDPRLVREVLAEMETRTTYSVGKARGIHSKTLTRWSRRRAADPSWPSDDYIAAWIGDREANGTARAARTLRSREYKKKVYLNRGPLQLDSTGTVRRVRALYALGWTSSNLAPRLGVSPARVGHLASGKWARVHPTTAAAVAALYDELSMTVPRDPDVLAPRQTRIHDRQRRQSAAKGWAPPLAWDDIDDPNEQPTDWAYRPARGGDRAATIRELAARGAGISEVCRVMHMSRDALQRWCQRNDLASLYRRVASREDGVANDNGNQHTTRPEGNAA